MISKKFRLNTREVKKVFHQRKPFFSNFFIINARPNLLGKNRFALLLWGKNINGSVERNFFRRLFYTEASKILKSEHSYDLVFVPKKKQFFSVEGPQGPTEFAWDIRFWLKKIFHNH